MNKAEIKGKNIWPFLAFIWFITILKTVAYIDSIVIDQLSGTTILKFVVVIYNINITIVVIIRYKPMFVNDNWILPNKSAFTLSKSLIVNWSNGLLFI